MILAIDPGASGGIAMLFKSGKLIVEPMPETDKDIIDLVVDSLKCYQDDILPPEDRRCVIEKVGGFAGKDMPGSRMFSFGRGVGFLHGVMMSLNFRIENPTPQAWIKVLALGTRGTMTKTEWKNKLKQRAQQLFPQVNGITLKTADALLILEAAKRQVF
jgi:hypothetical protein